MAPPRRKVRTDIEMLAATLSGLQPGDLNAIWLGALLTGRLHDGAYAATARSLAQALALLRSTTLEAGSSAFAPAPAKGGRSGTLAKRLDATVLRHALRHERKLAIAYADAKGRRTRRVIWPLDAADFGPNGAILCWCETRNDFRNFRLDRIADLTVLEERSDVPREVMLALHEATLDDGFET